MQELVYLANFLVDLSHERKEGVDNRVEDAVGYPVWTAYQPCQKTKG